MAKIVCAGSAVVIKFGKTYEELEAVAKYRPESLTVKDGEEPVFAVSASGSGAGRISRYGAEFVRTGNDATITLMEESVSKESVAEKYGSAILYLNDVEKKIEEVMPQIEEDINAVMSCIDI